MKEHNTLINKSYFTNHPSLTPSLSASAIDPFGMLPVDTSRLQMLLGDSKELPTTKDKSLFFLTLNILGRARKASEPVFSITEELAFQNFHTVFRTGLTDPALSNAVMFSLLFAVTEGNLDLECLKYKVCVIGCIRDKVAYIKGAVLESTIGAILLLVGVEVGIYSRFSLQEY